ncbi:armadillo-type protein [Lasiosphaeria miniovina]|uniref:Armadillo-type protein n=1 Tax=Lasiosphaeria miniovina TaxID=1954250 RepID=A0AA40BHH4_9PEZI|nr:armadillo-type protein [Lasiosphaeria miniovina]KAK0734323.1 armadillo-type protein [Lasiosphaeria miniovina]
MSFAIEVPGEAAPLSIFELGRALEAAATSTDNAQRQSAGQQLQAWEVQPNYYSTLQTIFLDKSLRNEIRFLAIILIKNGIEKYWRRSVKNSLKPQEKDLIRSRLFQGSIDEEEKNLSLHNALVTAKLVRIDYPTEWPDAVPMIINITRSSKDGNPVHLGGALLLLLRVVKELATARMRHSQTTLQAITPELVQLLGEIYTAKTAYWQDFFTKGRGEEDDADYAMQNSLTALKILRRLVIIGYEQPHTDNMVREFWSLSQSQFDQFLRGVSHESWIPIPYQDVVGKHLIQFTKLHIDMCESRPASFPLLPNSIPLVGAYWNLVKDFSDVFEKSGGIKQSSTTPAGNPKHEGPLSEKLALKGLLLIRSCIATAYRPAQTFKYRSVEAKILEKQAIEAIKTDLLTKDLLYEMVQVIISKLFIFRKSDLNAWEEDPEGWEAQEANEGQAYEWAVRPCAERLLVDLLIHYPDLHQPLLTYCELAIKVQMDIVTKEAAYCALGCAAITVNKEFDFDQFLNATLVNDVQIDDTMAKLLRRRIAILLSQWVPVKIVPTSRAVVYGLFRHLMNPDDKHNDEVVRITSARQFKHIVDDFGFDAEAFLPYASDYFNLLTGLLQEVDSDEAKLALLETLRLIVTRMDEHVSQFGDAIMATIPKLWEASGSEEYMIKQAVLAIMSSLVMAMHGESQRYQGTITPLLREAMNPDSALNLHLIEESVELWKSMLMQSTPPINSEVTRLVELVLPLLQYSSEVSKSCLEIVKNYIILAPSEMLSDGLRRPTLIALKETLDATSRKKAYLGVTSIDLIIRSAEALGGSQGVSLIVQDMMETGILVNIFEGLHSAWEAGQTVGPNKKKSKINSLNETDYFAILARIAVADPAVFATMLSGLGNGLESVWPWLATRWFANFDSMSDINRQKLSCLALTRLCELPNPMQDLVLARLQDFLSMWTSVVTELTDDPDGRDCLVWDQLPSNAYDTPLDVYENRAACKDPVHAVAALEFVNLRLRDLVQRAGGEQAFEANWAVNVDKEVLAGFQRLGQPRQTGE